MPAPGCLRDATHRGAHASVGGRRRDGGDGDFHDAAAGPNDPIFFFHHANVDRNFHWWASRRAARVEREPRRRGERTIRVASRRRPGDAADAWGYPVAGVEGTDAEAGRAYYGQALFDAMSDAWGTPRAALGLDGGGLATHADALCALAPGHAPYASRGRAVPKPMPGGRGDAAGATRIVRRTVAATPRQKSAETVRVSPNTRPTQVR